MNDKLAEKVEVNLFPLILEKALLTPQDAPEKTKFMISVTGAKRRKFWQNKLVEYFKIYKKDLLLGFLSDDGDNFKFVFPEYLDDPLQA